jgi:MFS transporter, MHS family, shikimate and dehydroshikimate transport protein
VAAAGGAQWVVAACIAALCVVSLIAFLAAPELKDMDIAEAGPTQLRANR